MLWLAMVWFGAAAFAAGFSLWEILRPKTAQLRVGFPSADPSMLAWSARAPGSDVFCLISFFLFLLCCCFVLVLFVSVSLVEFVLSAYGVTRHVTLHERGNQPNTILIPFGRPPVFRGGRLHCHHVHVHVFCPAAGSSLERQPRFVCFVGFVCFLALWEFLPSRCAELCRNSSLQR